MGLGRVWWRKLSMLGLVVGVGLALGVTSGCSGKKSEDSTSLTDDSLGGGSLDEFSRTGKNTGGGRFEDVLFAYDSADLDGTALEATKANADLLRKESGKVEIEGHCDDRGTAEYNLALGARRAKAVRDSLVALGVKSSRMSTVSYGEELPICQQADESCWSRNRRGHVVDLSE